MIYSHKIHFLERDGHYACNKACSITEEKCTRDKTKITCLNCKLRVLKVNPIKKGVTLKTELK